jgi:predicted nucleic acid-binding OB-fold protein
MSQDQVFDDASIPVLTEVVQETAPHAAPAAADAAVAEVVVDEAPLAAPAMAQVLEERAAAALGEEEWDALELRLCERIVHQLQGRVDFVLHQRVRDSMTEVLQQALSGLTDELRSGLEQTIEQIVSRAVAQELAHLKTLKQ